MEDGADVPERVGRLLERASSAGIFELAHVPSLEKAVAHLAERDTDVVLLDLDLPDEDADVSAVEQLVRSYPAVPVVVLSSSDDAAVALESVRRGAQDYLPTSQLNSYMLARVLRYAIERARWVARANREAEQLREVNARLDEFAGLVAHDLKGPMTSIVGLAETLPLVEGPELSERQRELLSRLSLSTQRLASVVDGLLDATRESSFSRRQRVDLRAISEEVVALLGPAVGEAQAEVLVGELPDVWGVPALYRQLLLNLVGNALAHHGGPHPPKVVISARTTEDEVVVTVEDDGQGIPQESRDRVFLRGYTTGSAGNGHAGLGQGLAAARTAAARLGGRLWVDDSQLGGAALRLGLPRRALAQR